MLTLVDRLFFYALGTMHDSLSHPRTDLKLVVRSKDFLLSFCQICLYISPSIPHTFTGAQQQFASAW